MITEAIDIPTKVKQSGLVYVVSVLVAVVVVLCGAFYFILEQEADKRIAVLEARFDGMESRFDGMEQRTNARFDRLEAKMDRLLER